MTDEPMDQLDQEEIEAQPDAPADQAEEATTDTGPKLTLKRGGGITDITFPVNSPCVIGRFDAAVGPVDVDLGTIDEGVYISRKHAKITLEDGVWKVHDLGSSNGTFVLRDDFERVEEAELVDGAEIAFGNARFVFNAGSRPVS